MSLRVLSLTTRPNGCRATSEYSRRYPRRTSCKCPASGTGGRQRLPRRSTPTVCCQAPDRTELLSVTICPGGQDQRPGKFDRWVRPIPRVNHHNPYSLAAATSIDRFQTRRRNELEIGKALNDVAAQRSPLTHDTNDIKRQQPLKSQRPDRRGGPEIQRCPLDRGAPINQRPQAPHFGNRPEQRSLYFFVGIYPAVIDSSLCAPQCQVPVRRRSRIDLK